jgi:hypothetical protein
MPVKFTVSVNASMSVTVLIFLPKFPVVIKLLEKLVKINYILYIISTFVTN